MWNGKAKKFCWYIYFNVGSNPSHCVVILKSNSVRWHLQISFGFFFLFIFCEVHLAVWFPDQDEHHNKTDPCGLPAFCSVNLLRRSPDALFTHTQPGKSADCCFSLLQASDTTTHVTLGGRLTWTASLPTFLTSIWWIKPWCCASCWLQKFSCVRLLCSTTWHVSSVKACSDWYAQPVRICFNSISCTEIRN